MQKSLATAPICVKFQFQFSVFGLFRSYIYINYLIVFSASQYFSIFLYHTGLRKILS